VKTVEKLMIENALRVLRTLDREGIIHYRSKRASDRKKIAVQVSLLEALRE
jgi:hypothetical protein